MKLRHSIFFLFLSLSLPLFATEICVNEVAHNSVGPLSSVATSVDASGSYTVAQNPSGELFWVLDAERRTGLHVDYFGWLMPLRVPVPGTENQSIRCLAPLARKSRGPLPGILALCRGRSVFLVDSHRNLRTLWFAENGETIHAVSLARSDVETDNTVTAFIATDDRILKIPIDFTPTEEWTVGKSKQIGVGGADFLHAISAKSFLFARDGNLTKDTPAEIYRVNRQGTKRIESAPVMLLSLSASQIGSRMYASYTGIDGTYSLVCRQWEQRKGEFLEDERTASPSRVTLASFSRTFKPRNLPERTIGALVQQDRRKSFFLRTELALVDGEIRGWTGSEWITPRWKLLPELDPMTDVEALIRSRIQDPFSLEAARTRTSLGRRLDEYDYHPTQRRALLNSWANRVRIHRYLLDQRSQIKAFLTTRKIRDPNQQLLALLLLPEEERELILKPYLEFPARGETTLGKFVTMFKGKTVSELQRLNVDVPLQDLAASYSVPSPEYELLLEALQRLLGIDTRAVKAEFEAFLEKDPASGNRSFGENVWLFLEATDPIWNEGESLPTFYSSDEVLISDDHK